MIATVLVGLLCFYTLIFAVMFLLISRRLHGVRMGMSAFALGSFLLSLAYVLQLLEAAPGSGWMSVTNHSATLCALVAYGVGGARFFGASTPLLRPVVVVGLGYALLQLLTQGFWGPVGRYALLAASCAALFAAMVTALLMGLRSFARDLRGEVVLFVVLIGGICVLNLIKLLKLVSGGLEALDMDDHFQMVFYLYMCTLATILPPGIIWLVLRRLTDALSDAAARDPLTHLLNRRGMNEALARHFQRSDGPAYLLLVDVDHFKQVNDHYGHHVGDAVLCAVAGVLLGSAQDKGLACRLGGEEFALICLGGEASAAAEVAERVRSSIAKNLDLEGVAAPNLRCTVTIGVSEAFADADAVGDALRQADAALYRGKHAGRNRVEWTH